MVDDSAPERICPAAWTHAETLRPGGLDQIPEWVPEAVTAIEPLSERYRNDSSRSGGPEVEPDTRPEPFNLPEVSTRFPGFPVRRERKARQSRSGSAGRIPDRG